MKVTAIRQSKAPDRYNIYVDEAFAFRLSASSLLESGLVLGQELSEAEVAAYKGTADSDKLYGLTLNYVSLRPRSTWEVTTYLQRKGAPTPLLESILNKLSMLRMVDDRSFAESVVHHQRTLRQASRRKIILELKKKRVAEDIIREVMSEEIVDDLSTLRQLVERKRRQAKYQDNTKLLQYLARQGYRYDDIKRVLGELGADSVALD